MFSQLATSPKSNHVTCLVNASASSLFVYSPLATAGVLVASTTSAPTPVPAAPPSLKPVPSCIFLPLRLS